MIFQDPLSAMHPFFTVGNQIIEAYRIHNHVTKAAARTHAIDMLARVGIPQPKSRVDDYPHQFSGGMRQRAMIAMALSCDPELLIADEPTTALDVTVQAQILDLILDLQQEFNSAVIVITHDLGVVAELADDIMVMYAGRSVEYASAEQVFSQPEHPYTWGLLGSMPRLDRDRADRLLPIKGTPPSLINVPDGCPFNPRCGYPALVTGDACTTERPEFRRRRRRPPDRLPPLRPTTATRLGRRNQPEPVTSSPHTDSKKDRIVTTAQSRESAAENPPRRRPADRRRAAEVLPGAQGPAAARDRRGQSGRRPRLHGAARRDAVPGRRVRLRQDHHRPHADPADRTDRGQDRVRRPGHHATCPTGRCDRCAATSR